MRNRKAQRVTYTARFPADLYRWLHEQAAGSGYSLNDLVVRTVADLKDAHDLPRVMAEALEEDRNAAKLPPREYLRNLLALRYAELVKSGGRPGGDE